LFVVRAFSIYLFETEPEINYGLILTGNILFSINRYPLMLSMFRSIKWVDMIFYIVQMGSPVDLDGYFPRTMFVAEKKKEWDWPECQEKKFFFSLSLSLSL